MRGTLYPDHVDHDHLFGNVRGILCFSRDDGLGQVGDDLQHPSTAIRY
ncbi:endonuclease domain-containing protein [Planosporangium mesophilum]|nr:hypothetical protein [Planosporangium mesophilum]